MNIRKDLEALEAMLVYWNMVLDREKVSDMYISDLAGMPQFSAIFDGEFGPEQFRRVLSAVSNRELLNGMVPKEARFWNNNLYILEDREQLARMTEPLKALAAGDLAEGSGDRTITVSFVPMTTEEYLVKDDTLYVNFFRIMASPWEPGLTIGGTELTTWLKEKISTI